MSHFEVDGIQYYPINGKDNEVQVGNGNSGKHTACTECPEFINIPSIVIDTEGKEKTVTKIANWAFYYCRNTRKVFISKTIQSIGYAAFNSVDASEYIFEQGSQLKQIEEFGVGWMTASSFVLPPSVQTLSEGSLRGFIHVKDFYYCGTYTFDGIKVFTSRDDTYQEIVDTLKIHVTKQFNSDYFGNIKIYDHNLKCEVPFLCRTLRHRRHIHISLCLFVFIL